MKNIPEINIEDIPEFATDDQIKDRQFEFDCLINNWTDELLSLRKPKFTHKFDLSNFADDFIHLAYGESESVRDNFKSDFISLINPAFPKEAFNNLFVRLNRRSPKDYKIHIHTVDEAFESISSSMRCIDDISFLRYHKQPIIIYFSEYDWEIPEREFRCFVKNKKLIAVTQYEGTKIKEYPENCIEEVKQKIKDFSGKVIRAAQLDTFVFDVFFKKDNCHFLEINPYGLSDPCFFINYKNVERGGFAYQKTEIIKI